MMTVIIALLPATGFGIYNFGPKALAHILITVAACVLTELGFELLVKKPITIGDFSAVVTGLLLALNLPVSAPLWIGALGGFFAILVVKMLFGGLGQNFMNPALGARCFLLLSFTQIMTNFDCDSFTGATPLALVKENGSVNILNMVIGKTAGTIGETSMIAILIGACILLIAGVIDLRVPGTYLVSFVIFIVLFGGHGFDPAYIIAHLAGGGLMLGAIFMATDYATSPVTAKGQIVYGIGCGILTVVFRYFGLFPEGVTYAILLMNAFVWTIDRYTAPRRFGVKKGGKKA
jgi:Na+-translocating ferredoxin:NAD+ oxidoreductase RnfD subunit